MKPHIEWRLAFVLVWAITGSRANARAGDWPLVRGDVFGTGVAHGTLPDTPEVLWKFSAGKDAGFDATAVIADGVIYVGDNAGAFHAIRLADGTEVWKKEFADSGFGAGAAVEQVVYRKTNDSPCGTRCGGARTRSMRWIALVIASTASACRWGILWCLT